MAARKAVCGERMATARSERAIEGNVARSACNCCAHAALCRERAPTRQWDAHLCPRSEYEWVATAGCTLRKRRAVQEKSEPHARDKLACEDALRRGVEDRAIGQQQRGREHVWFCVVGKRGLSLARARARTRAVVQRLPDVVEANRRETQVGAHGRRAGAERD
jgi:hypothetical protein